MNRTDTAISAVSKLALFLKGEMLLTESHYDACCDTLIQLLEDTRDLAYKLRRDEEDDASARVGKSE